MLEPGRSLRQSTLAKRSNVSPSVNVKKLPVKSGSAQKGGLKQQDKGQTKQDASNAAESPEDVRQSGDEPCQSEEATEVSPSPNNLEWVACPSKSDKVKGDTEHSVPNQAKIIEASHELGNSSHLSRAIFPAKAKESGRDVIESGSVAPGLLVSAYVETNQVQNNSPAKGNETMANKVTSEMSSGEETDYKTEQNEAMMDDKSKETGMADIPLVTTGYETTSAIQEDLAIPTSFVDGKPESGLQHSGDMTHKITLPDEDKQKPLENPGKSSSKNSFPLDSMILDQNGSENIHTTFAKTECNTLEGETVQNIPGLAVHQQADSVSIGDHKTSELQEGEHSSTSSKCVRDVKPKHVKLKQNIIAATQQKLASVSQEVHSKMPVLPGVHSRTSVSLKRHAEEQMNLQHFHKPVKVKKKHADKDVKAQSSDSVVALKKQPHILGINIPRIQIPAQARKSSTEKGSDKSHGRHAGSKETLHQIPGPVHLKQGQLSQSNQKQLQKHQVSKTNNCVKEEGVKKDSTGVAIDHLKEDEREKLKLKKLEKGLQPRQRRSSRSLSVDEPPLFIPDNISTIKRESSEQLSPSESKSPWVPSKQCGFCRKPHGNRCVCVHIWLLLILC